MKIAVITPSQVRPDHLTRTIIDGLENMRSKGEVEYCISQVFEYEPFAFLKQRLLSRSDFIAYAHDADLIFFCWGKGGTNYDLARDIGAWKKTVFIDGSELGGNRRFDLGTVDALVKGTYRGQGAIEVDMLSRCGLYCRREKPYHNSILPLPFGIERTYVAYREGVKKDIDIVCVFGQDEYPLLRREVTLETERFCRENSFVCSVNMTSTPQEFYALLARAKVGVSVGGGGFDTGRFWEILGNNCALLTETIDIYPEGSTALSYSRIKEFSSRESFKQRLQEILPQLREEVHNDENTAQKDEYRAIMNAHSSEARVLQIIEECRARGILH